ncbi:MAG: hypothetical protein WB789_04925 [Thermoplasmata archaeon]
MTNPILETIAEIAKAERKTAVKEGDYVWAVFVALVEDWAINESRKGGGAIPS